MDKLRAHRAAPCWQLGRVSVVVCRAVPRHGVRAADVAREPARHRGQPVGECRQAVCDGLSLGGQALQAGRRQRIARLAHLVGPGRLVDPARAQAVRQRFARRRFGQHGPCAGLQHHRSVAEPVRMGAVSLDQGGHQVAHVAGPARRDSRVHPHQRRQAARPERAGHAGLRGRRVLRDGPWLRGLRAAVCIAPGRRLLRHAREVAGSEALLGVGNDREGAAATQLLGDVGGTEVGHRGAARWCRPPRENRRLSVRVPSRALAALSLPR
jgi:hypothetical protein